MALEKAPESTPPPSSPSKSQQKMITNSLGMEFVEIPASMVSSGPNDPASAIDRPFFMGRHEVTQTQWETVMGGNPSHFKRPDNPVENVSWYDAQDFVRRLNELEGHKRYRLPTEAEWEYAAKAGSTTAYSFGEYDRELGRHAWYSDNAEGRTHPVGQKEPNPWGLYDVHGNVEEWVQDWWWPYHDTHLDMIEAAENLSKADLKTNFQIIRGCSWESPAPYCTTKVSSESLPENRNPTTGLRLVMSVE